MVGVEQVIPPEESIANEEFQKLEKKLSDSEKKESGKSGDPIMNAIKTKPPDDRSR